MKKILCNFSLLFLIVLNIYAADAVSVIWSKLYLTERKTTPDHCTIASCLLSNGNLVISSSESQSVFITPKLVTFSINSNGDTLWSIPKGYSGFAPCSDGCFYATVDNNLESPGGKILLQKFNSNGETLNSMVLSDTFSNSSYPTGQVCAISTDNQSTLCFATVGSKVLFYDTAGCLKKTLAIPERIEIFDLLYYDSSTFFMPGLNTWYGAICAFGRISDKQITTKTYTNSMSDQGAILSAIKVENNKILLIGWQKLKTDINHDGFLVKINTNLDTIWKLQLDNSGTDFLKSGIMLNDSIYIVIGHTKSYYEPRNYNYNKFNNFIGGRGWLVFISNSGKKIFSVELGDTACFLMNIYRLNNTEFLLVGVKQYDDENRAPWVTRVKINLDELSIKNNRNITRQVLNFYNQEFYDLSGRKIRVVEHLKLNGHAPGVTVSKKENSSLMLNLK